MRIFLIASLFVFSVSIGLSQASNVINAYNYMQAGQLDKAKEAADKAVLHESTSKSAKAWKYRGDIYYRILASEDANYKSLSDDPLSEMFTCYKNVLKFDQKRMYKTDIKRNFVFINGYSLNEGVKKFNDSEYLKARDYFIIGAQAAEEMGEKDSLAIYNTGLACERMNDFPAAINYYEQCLEMGYQPKEMYSYIIYLHKVTGDQENYNAILEKALSAYPNHQDFLIAKLNSLARKGENTQALEYVNKAIQNDPNNKALYFSKGSFLDGLNQRDEAELAYKKSLSIDDKYFDANYNLGALYFNYGVEINNASSDITDQELYEKKQDEANSVFRKSMIYLEKAHEIKPNDANTMASLKVLYARMGLTEKYNQIKRKIEGN